MVRQAVEKVIIVLAHKEPRLIDRVGTSNRVIVDDGDGGSCWRAQDRARCIAKIDVESLWPFQIRIIDDQDRDGLGSFARRKLQRSERGNVVTLLARQAIRDVAILQA